MSRPPLPEIETGRFRLRQLNDDNFDEWASLKYADPVMMRYMPPSELEPLARAKSARSFFDELWSEYGYGAWLVFDKQNDQLLGDCYLEPEAASESGEVEIGYDVGRAFWGRGIATEVARAVLRFSFENLAVARILGIVAKDNLGSRRVLENLGFEVEQEAILYGLDAVVYALSHDRFDPGNAFYRVKRPAEKPGSDET